MKTPTVELKNHKSNNEAIYIHYTVSFYITLE